MAENLEKLTNLEALKKLGEAAKKAISTKIGSVYKPVGSKEFAQLPDPAKELVGNVYNISDKFTTNEKFVDGTGKEMPAGTNIVVVEVDGEYKFDALAGMVDTSEFVTKDGAKVLSTNDYTTEEKTKLAGIKEGATKTEASETEGNIKIDGVEVPVVSIASDEEVQAIIDEIFPTE